jgi:ribonuclease III
MSIQQDNPEIDATEGLDPLFELEKAIRYTFKDRSILEESLQHSSFVNEQNGSGLRDNERLEFLGDAVVNLIIGHLLMNHFPEVNEGELSRMRAFLVNEAQLAAVAREIRLGDYLRLGRGEVQSEGQNKPSILADALEALVAAVYLDGGFDAAFGIVESRFTNRLQENGENVPISDYKSRLQEMVQTAQLQLPTYTIVSEEGPDHDKTFRVRLNVGELQAEGEGKSKKAAEQSAAEKALDLFIKKP